MIALLKNWVGMSNEHAYSESRCIMKYDDDISRMEVKKQYKFVYITKLTCIVSCKYIVYYNL